MCIKYVQDDGQYAVYVACLNIPNILKVGMYPPSMFFCQNYTHWNFAILFGLWGK
jgi:hypothetical protein